MEQIHTIIIVKGRVHGVYFRASTKHRADDLGICGQVKNQDDGTVWIAAEGEEAAMDAFIAWCRQGPPLAKVTDVQVEKVPLQGYKGFEIVK